MHAVVGQVLSMELSIKQAKSKVWKNHCKRVIDHYSVFFICFLFLKLPFLTGKTVTTRLYLAIIISLSSFLLLKVQLC